ncbi:hypothetical protein [Gloeothece citriformis]|uniref:hypothetical protein n=1 Tax=Gloeothece citriformis TaxID=2546356 RepID=UPI003B834760
MRKILVMMLIIFALNACSSPKPPTEFAPDGETIQKAILLQLNQTEQRLSQQLNAVHPELAISQIKVKTLEPVYVAELPAYHLQGSYTLKLTLPRQQVTQKNNRFDIYLQRQTEGKTWRLLRRDLNPVSQEPQWSSYFVGSWEQGTEN